MVRYVGRLIRKRQKVGPREQSSPEPQGVSMRVLLVSVFYLNIVVFGFPVFAFYTHSVLTTRWIDGYFGWRKV